ncbi:MAG TPA: hypothetical protein VLA35_09770 [Thermoleophilia bacterium]|nr:hypothetical protein [Thermoleophilia bacterium]
MPEAAPGAPAGEAGAAAAAATDEPRAAVDGPAGPAGHRFFYGLGIGVQTLLWFLLFLAIVVAVAVGGELTEFRYVGF